ncbi:hypothetical protein Pmani_011696 [Petrolisthes manimaculis]|uniref:Uncharacterized protein n=1 Tax=Petrolisthes manimaculis TaxID=1843537 RepID=A0AAE1Q090_9EUCA|nr:hypothetical protein Pmani_011696 [Petrolisthes manimaculis]
MIPTSTTPSPHLTLAEHTSSGNMIPTSTTPSPHLTLAEHTSSGNMIPTSTTPSPHSGRTYLFWQYDPYLNHSITSLWQNIPLLAI